MKIKKLIIPAIVGFIIILTALILLYSLCVINVKYEVQIVSGCECEDSPRGTYNGTHWEGKNSPYQDDSAKKEITVEFNGVAYSGTYEYSQMRVPNSYIEHRYKGENDEGIIEFSINADDDKITMIDLPIKRDKLIENEEWCKEIANDFVSKYIKVSDYKVYSSGAEGHYGGTYTYYKEIDGYKTSECISVTVDGYGRICGFEAESLGEFDCVKKVNYNEEKVKDAIKSSLDGVYGGNGNWCDFEIENITLIKLDGLKYGFLCSISVNTVNKNHGLKVLVE